MEMLLSRNRLNSQHDKLNLENVVTTLFHRPKRAHILSRTCNQAFYSCSCQTVQVGLGMLVGGVVVEDDVDRLYGGYLCFDQVRKRINSFSSLGSTGRHPFRRHCPSRAKHARSLPSSMVRGVGSCVANGFIWSLNQADDPKAAAPHLCGRGAARCSMAVSRSEHEVTDSQQRVGVESDHEVRCQVAGGVAQQCNLATAHADPQLA